MNALTNGYLSSNKHYSESGFSSYSSNRSYHNTQIDQIKFQSGTKVELISQSSTRGYAYGHSFSTVRIGGNVQITGLPVGLLENQVIFV